MTYLYSIDGMQTLTYVSLTYVKRYYRLKKVIID